MGSLYLDSETVFTYEEPDFNDDPNYTDDPDSVIHPEFNEEHDHHEDDGGDAHQTAAVMLKVFFI